MNALEKESRRIAELDGLRGVAIIAVFLVHSFGIPLLWAGVDLFFVLSGFLITGILLRQKASGGPYFIYFYERRARRILLPYVLVLAVSSLAFGTGWTKHWYWFAFFATNVGAALDQLGDESFLPLWSLAVEEQFYLIWPFIVRAAKANTLLLISLLIVIGVPILRAVATPWFSTYFPIYYLTPFRMDLLASGATLAWIQRWKAALLKNLSFWPQVTMLCAAGLLIGLAVLDPGFRTSANTVRSNVGIYSFTNIMVTSLVIIALTGRGIICHVLRNSTLAFLGKISYSMYLIHQGALLFAAQFFTGKVVVFGVALVITLAYATASWYGLERPLLLPHRVAKRRETPVAA